MNPNLKSKRPEVFGRCDPAFQTVADVFAQNFTARGDAGDVGASCAVTIAGETVVDLWGGYADVDAGRAWTEDTLACCWSVSKAIGATLVLRLVDQGKLDLDTPVARYWPAFGKEKILVRHLLDHRCALTYVDAPLAPGDLYDWDMMIAAIEATAPNWAPGEKPVYLNMTQGYLTGGLCAQVNGGRRLGAFFRDEIAQPLGIDWHLGVPDDDLPRVARVYRDPPDPALAPPPDSLFAKSMKGFDPAEDFNSLKWRKAEIGSGSSHTNARAMAKFFGALASGKILSPEVLRHATTEAGRNLDPLFGCELRFSTGFELHCPPATPMPGSRSFGYIGAGCSYAYADPDLQLGFGYSHNFMHGGIGPGPCGGPLIEAVAKAAR